MTIEKHSKINKNSISKKKKPNNKNYNSSFNNIKSEFNTLKESIQNDIKKEPLKGISKALEIAAVISDSFSGIYNKNNKNNNNFILDLKNSFDIINKNINKANKGVQNIEKDVNRKIRKYKKDLISEMFFIFFVFLTIISLSIGIIILVSDFIPLEIILLTFGVIFAIFALFFKLN